MAACLRSWTRWTTSAHWTECRRCVSRGSPRRCHSLKTLGPLPVMELSSAAGTAATAARLEPLLVCGAAQRWAGSAARCSGVRTVTEGALLWRAGAPTRGLCATCSGRTRTTAAAGASHPEAPGTPLARLGPALTPCSLEWSRGLLGYEDRVHLLQIYMVIQTGAEACLAKEQRLMLQTPNVEHGARARVCVEEGW